MKILSKWWHLRLNIVHISLQKKKNKNKKKKKKKKKKFTFRCGVVLMDLTHIVQGYLIA